MQFLQQRGHSVLGVDRDPDALQSARAYGQVLLADVENHPWPLTQQFDAVVVTNYLWRPLWPALLASLKPAGVLLYETFAEGNETVGRPARPEFLLRRGELLEVCAELHVVAFEQGFMAHPERYVQRIAAVASQENAPWPLANR
jgi:SAM-dependent methyltransferase